MERKGLVLLQVVSPLVIPSVSVEEGKQAWFLSGWRHKLQFCPIWQISAVWARGPSIPYFNHVPRPGIKPEPSVLEAWSLNHWTTREVSVLRFLVYISKLPSTIGYQSAIRPALWEGPHSTWESHLFWEKFSEKDVNVAGAKERPDWILEWEGRESVDF